MANIYCLYNPHGSCACIKAGLKEMEREREREMEIVRERERRERLYLPTITNLEWESIDLNAAPDITLVAGTGF